MRLYDVSNLYAVDFDNVPTIDAEIVVHAHVKINWLGDCHCSNCNGYIDYTSKYCNWCGAKLDEPEERE